MKTIKWIVLYVVSVGVGSFIDSNILEKININIWLSRGIGCLATVIIALLMYHCLFTKKASQ
ncbi:MAG TPA: hypothetical protein DG942_02770 [Ruminococcaceae bacterium]|jgi:hypothetical protein|nr:hypothetical protein [Oscillospiraceae bacterium]